MESNYQHLVVFADFQELILLFPDVSGGEISGKNAVTYFCFIYANLSISVYQHVDCIVTSLFTEKICLFEKPQTVMHISGFRILIQVLCLILVSKGDWQIINDQEPVEEINLQEENLLPAESLAAYVNTGRNRKLAFVDQNGNIFRNPKTDLKIEKEVSSRQPQHPPVLQTTTHKVRVNSQQQSSTLSSSIDNHSIMGQVPGKAAIFSDEDVDFRNEEFLLVDKLQDKTSINSRGLTQFVDTHQQDTSKSISKSNFGDISSSKARTSPSQNFSQEEVQHGQDKFVSDSENRSTVTEGRNTVIGDRSTFTDGKSTVTEVRNTVTEDISTVVTDRGTVTEDRSIVTGDISTFTESKSIVAGSRSTFLTEKRVNRDEIEVKKDIIVDSVIDDFRMACVSEESWECKMFREGFIAIKRHNQSTSGRSSANNRSKRQTLLNTNNKNYNTRHILQLLDCRNNDCFSGSETDPNEQEIVPEFHIKSSLKIRTNLTNSDLTRSKKREISTILKEQLNFIFQDIPGLKNITVNPNKISVLDGNIVAPWVASIDGGNPIFSGMNGKEVRYTIEESLNRAAENFQRNVALDGKHPINRFDPKQAAVQVEQQARDPCKMNPSPCPNGFGSCERLPNRGNGIELRCIINCQTFGVCHNSGTCEKDMTGKAFCQCPESRLGLYCENLKDTESKADQQTYPEYKFKSQSTFNSTFSLNDVTPGKLDVVSKNITQQLKNLFVDLHGFHNVIINSIQVKDQRLLIDWDASLDPTSFIGMGTDQMVDVVRDHLQSISNVYNHGIVIGGQLPLHDFDYVAAADQIHIAASDPCSTQPCSFGYGNCRAYNPVSVLCIHNCNTISACKNGGKCHLKSSGEAFCQCTKRWTGKACTKAIEYLDGGKITGIAVGTVLSALGILGCCFWILVGRRRRHHRETVFTNYIDEGRSANPYRLFIFDRPHVSIPRLPIFGPSTNI